MVRRKVIWGWKTAVEWAGQQSCRCEEKDAFYAQYKEHPSWGDEHFSQKMTTYARELVELDPPTLQRNRNLWLQGKVFQ